MTERKQPQQEHHSISRLSENDGAPLYQVVKYRVSEPILTGEWPAGTVLPSENALAANFGVSVGTMRKALAALVDEGMLMRRRKTGTVVTGWAQVHNLGYFFQYFRLHGRGGELLHSETTLLDYQQRNASQTEAEKLQIAPGDSVYSLQRLRRVKDVPAMHERLVLPAARLADFPDAENLPPLLYRFLLEHYGLRVAAVREQITAELATEEDLRLLELQGPHAIMLIDEVSFDQSAIPVIFAHHRFSTDRFMYVNDIR
ncbi:GntR family transcriptional regulator [Izhakiella australiensis]|uniref:GntR family transcriptional regulator n=1 Tax=Izhakiella australiensis TaxID=1926881 RepID=A0A1S8YNC3_9GAMM|nr:GntR family transcriptional regulator [Izhakiella australiensis]OON40355.1 GntR family transcriptional regulator [Izhakiella australiensis]